jgi:prepilin-type N-terminal cleavage/methylation domain-containing protein
MHSRGAHGFTLIEVTIATGLLVVIALGTAQLFALALHQNMEARRQLAMSLLAARKADDLTIAAASGALRGAAGGAVDRSVDGFADIVDDGGAVYARRWTVAAVPGRGDLLAIVVRVQPSGSRAAAGPDVVQIATICEAPP